MSIATETEKVWGVTDDSTEKPQGFLSGSCRSLPTLIDQGRDVVKKFEIEGIPVLILIGRDGKVAHSRNGCTSRL